MIPLIAAFQIGARRFWIPVPLFVVWVLLLPICLLLLPFFVIACRVNKIPAGSALVAVWAVMSGLRGMRLAIAHPDVTFGLRFI